MSYTGPDGVERHSSILDVPDEPLRCFAFGHGWQPGPVTERQDYGMTVWTVQATCACSRLRTETINPTSGELLGTRQYFHGHGLMSRLPAERHEARLEFYRRARARAAGVAEVGAKRRRRQRA